MKGYFMLNFIRRISGLIKIVNVSAMLVFCILSGTIQASAEIIVWTFDNYSETWPVYPRTDCQYISEIREVTNCEYDMSELMIKMLENGKPFSICDESFLVSGKSLFFAFRENNKNIAYLYREGHALKCLKLKKESKKK